MLVILPFCIFAEHIQTILRENVLVLKRQRRNPCVSVDLIGLPELHVIQIKGRLGDVFAANDLHLQIFGTGKSRHQGERGEQGNQFLHGASSL